MLRERIIKTVSIIGGLLVFIFSVKVLYIDSNFGFSTEILELNYSAFPEMCRCHNFCDFLAFNCLCFARAIS